MRVATDRLSLDFGADRFEKNADGTYTVTLHDKETKHGATLTFMPLKPPIRHGDDGVVRGVHGEDMFYLFVPFFTTKPGGSGIGLVLSRQIAEAHGGTVTLENRVERNGCIATVRLPVT